MKRKTFSFSAAAIAATSVFTIAYAESSSALAQDEVLQTGYAEAMQANTDSTETPEVVPVFVEKEIVQDLPVAEVAPEPEANANSLHELVAETSVDGSLSEDMQCLAGAIYFESRGEPLSGQLAVGQVIINRAESRQFPSDYCGVVYQRSQFSFVRGGSMPRIKTGSKAWHRAKAIARIAHNGLWDSEAADSLYFHAKYVRPSWAKRKTARATINTHIFYR